MSTTVKCPECNGCMTKFWILPLRFYYCEFCKQFYGGRDDALVLQDKDYIHGLQAKNNEKDKK